MARRRRASSGNAAQAPGAAQYVKLEQRLVLLAWLNGHFGYEHNRDMLRGLKGPPKASTPRAAAISITS